MKEQLDLVLPGPSFLARRWRNLLVHGRVLNLGYLAILVACLWKLLAAVAVAIVFTSAALAFIPNLGISQSEAAQWWDEWSKTGEASPACRQRVTEIVEKWDVLSANFVHIREESEILSVFFICCSFVAAYVLVLVVWNYLYEGREEFRISASEPLLEQARAALPAGFPQTRLVVSSRTFARYRLHGGITTSISSVMLVRLLKGKVKEFQFALQHEAYHLECFDSLSNSLSMSFRRILAVAGAFAVALSGSFWIVDDLLGSFERSPLAPPARLITFIVIFFFVVRRLARLELPFLKHKELLADRYAWQSRPDVDLDAVYYRDAAGQVHPTRTERIKFLSEGQCATACQSFFTLQEVVLCCVFLVNSRIYDEAMGTLPRFLEFPSFVLAIFGSLILGAEACAYPVGDRDCKPLAWRGLLIVLGCLLLASRAHAPWFAVAILLINGFVLWRIGTPREKEQVLEGVADKVAPESMGGAPGARLYVPHDSTRLRRVLNILGAILSWIALLWAGVEALIFLLRFLLLLVFGMPAWKAATEPPWWRMVLNYGECAVLMFAAIRNLKRPHALTIAVEWFFYAAICLGFCLFGAWFAFLSSGGSGEEVVTKLLQLPWTEPQALQRRFWADIYEIGVLKIAGIALPPQVIFAGFYVWRARDANMQRMKERK